MLLEICWRLLPHSPWNNNLFAVATGTALRSRRVWFPLQWTWSTIVLIDSFSGASLAQRFTANMGSPKHEFDVLYRSCRHHGNFSDTPAGHTTQALADRGSLHSARGRAITMHTSFTIHPYIIHVPVGPTYSYFHTANDLHRKIATRLYRNNINNENNIRNQRKIQCNQ